jgi:TPR repeat protein/tRNA A-37 threonylcarbamoyl transferase component Bud32
MTVTLKKCPVCNRKFAAEMSVCPDDGTRLLNLPADPMVGRVLSGRYLILETIGRGGMGMVFKARHERMNKIVAVKILKESLDQTSVYARRFEVEARAAASLNHPNVIRMTDFDFSEEGLPFLVMDYLEGVPLEDVLARQKQLPLARALPIFEQICDALAHAHRRNVIHRDLKPSNIMLTRTDDGQEQAILVDFGIAKLFAGAEAERLTRTGEVFGTPLFMSPEQIMGQPLDGRSDIYSMGCLMYEALSGATPFAGETFMQIAYAHLNEKPDSLSATVPDMPADLDLLILKALNKKPADRPQSMQEMLSGLQAVTRGPSPAAPADQVAATDECDRGSFKETLAHARQGDPSCQYDVACMLRDGDGVEQDTARAFEFFLESASQGYDVAQSVLGNLFEYGEGVEASLEEAAKWYQKAAEQDNATAQFNLAHCYEVGAGFKPNGELALYWYQKSADNGNTSAYCQIGRLHEFELAGFKKNLAEAFKWYARATEAGDPEGPYNMARHYEEGLGREKNLMEAFKLYELAAVRGNKNAQTNLGLMYQFGDGVEKNIYKAHTWLSRGADDGNPAAEFLLANFLEEAALSREDFEEALSVYCRSADNGNESAIERLQELEDEAVSGNRSFLQHSRWQNWGTHGRQFVLDDQDGAIYVFQNGETLEMVTKDLQREIHKNESEYFPSQQELTSMMKLMRTANPAVDMMMLGLGTTIVIPGSIVSDILAI